MTLRTPKAPKVPRTKRRSSRRVAFASIILALGPLVVDVVRAFRKP
jgi:hypothetical protein